MQNALDAQVDVDSATATAVASVAFSLAVTDGNEGGAEAVAAPWDAGTAEAILTYAAASAMAAAHVAVTISAAAAAAATAAIDAAILIEGQLHTDEHLAMAHGIRRAIAAHAADVTQAVLQFTQRHEQGIEDRTAEAGPGTPAAAPAPWRDEPRHPEWASMLADPVLPAFLTEAGAEPSAVVFESPGERGLLRDLSLAQRMVSAVRDDEGEFQAAFDAAPAGLLLARVAAGRPAEVVHVNAAMSTFTGYPVVELLADGYLRLMPSELGVTTLPLEPAGGGPRHEQSAGQVQRWVHAHGHEILVRVRTATTSTSTGRVQHVICHVEPTTAG